MRHPNLRIILGPPGTGKTSNLVGLPLGAPNPSGLMGVVERELANGTRPDQIAYLAFTKKAATEGVERACSKFNLTPAALQHFRTIHSFTFRALRLKPGDVMQWSHYRELADALGIDLRGKVSLDDGLYGMDSGDRMMFLEGLARVKQCSLRSVWEDADEIDIDFRELDRFSRALQVFKTNHHLLDYTDMLEEFVRRAAVTVPPLEALIVDEGQDLSTTQWQVVEAIAARAKRVWIAGDDDQAIYKWAGADVDTFMGLQGQTTVLGESFRIPSSVHQLAAQIAGRMAKRTPKQWKPRAEKGAIHWYAGAEDVDMSTGTWLLLARNGYMLESLESVCRSQGFSYTSANRNPLESPALKGIITYERLRKGLGMPKDATDAMLKLITAGRVSQGVRVALKKAPADQPVTMAQLQGWGFMQDPPIWHQMLDRITDDDRDFFITARKRGETLTGKPRIQIATIHTVKGGEADHVLLLTDMSQRTFQELERRPDDEHRVQYVAVTRARRELHLIQPRTQYSYDL